MHHVIAIDTVIEAATLVPEDVQPSQVSDRGSSPALGKIVIWKSTAKIFMKIPRNAPWDPPMTY